MKSFTYFKGYQKDDMLRATFNALSIKTFKLSFEIWYQSGYWREKYIPYTFFDNDKAIANVSVNIMDFNVFGEQKRYIQIGTVMTDEAYRNKGLSRALMEKVFEDWNNNCDFIYLFANSSALGFYPKLGFVPVKEFQYMRKTNNSISMEIKKLDMDEPENRDKLYDYAKNTYIYGRFSMQENADLVMFYCITVYKENVYYLPELDVIAVVKFEGNQMHLLDIFSKTEQNLETVIDALNNENIKSVILGFVPKDSSLYDVVEIDEKAKDDVLFIQNNKTALFEENQLMFPLLSHA